MKSFDFPKTTPTSPKKISSPLLTTQDTHSRNDELPSAQFTEFYMKKNIII